MKEDQSFFDFAATVGLTKHIGGVEATEALAKLCQISKESYVLDAGCGVGKTTCYLARKYGCRVMGVDILEKMVEVSRNRANQENVKDRVEFRAADVQNLPFEDNLFDVVITESVTAFPENKQKAVCEYARVTKPGGFVGLNESTWIKIPPPPEMIAWASQDQGANVNPLTSSEWIDLLEGAGLKVIHTQTSKINLEDESKGIVKRYGAGSFIGILAKMLALYTTNPAYRKFVKEIKKEGIAPKNLDEYFGYGLYIGQKV
jgi:ubiquinone/menaquinone biosynthesis C-methylase UbiE